MTDVSELDVLIVDDHEVMRALLTRALSVAGVTHIRTAPNAAEALTQLRERPAHLVLADQNMPGMTGLEFIAAVRADATCGAPRIVMISGQVGKAHAEAARAAGADAVLPKPVSPRDLLQTIATLFA